ncbi:ABC transporter ATP-binding protein [Marinobacterium rhizophilum]|uniref:ABC transporter ATP-binding protein n=1 Tax=Marinobacterium rhizophilum TaxID=420402 RepID=UPI00036D2E5B|nr:ATP-binding cassette domain-containing protein [Marinobacterium rhizophilum]
MSDLLKTTNLNLSFGSIVVADNIDFSLKEGERLAVIGQNGAGKTTFINICTGLIRPDSGNIYFADEDITKKSARAIVKMGMVRSFQLPQVYSEHTVRECIELSLAARDNKTSLFKSLSSCVDQKEVYEVLTSIQLLDRSDVLAGSLPEGHKKLLDIAMALVLRPRLLIMDEPTSGVSSQEKHEIMRILMGVLDKYKVTSIFVEHDIDIVSQYATRVAAWISGAIAADGAPDMVLNDPVIQEQVLGQSFSRTEPNMNTVKLVKGVS